MAAGLGEGYVQSVHLRCDPRTYKNCYAVGLPHSDRRIGIRWALAIGALLPDSSLKLECFRQVTPRILGDAQRLLDGGDVHVAVDTSRGALFVDCRVVRGGKEYRSVIEGMHTRLVRLEAEGVEVPVEVAGEKTLHGSPAREELARMSFSEMIELAQSITDNDRERLRHGCNLNTAIALHGLTLFPKQHQKKTGEDPVSRASRLVCAGVYARMCGEDFLVMSLSGSGNKGITCSVPLVTWGRKVGADQNRIDEALALACLITSRTTYHLGTLSAVCGCSNAAGIGLSTGLVCLQGGGADQISLAINNMVGNVTGMVCDGAKIGCALKTMTSVDAAFRSASLAMNGIGIPVSDGIVGKNGADSLLNLGRIALHGMTAVDQEILRIMQEKLDSGLA
jgi:L-cysteine desulfidase